MLHAQVHRCFAIKMDDLIEILTSIKPLVQNETAYQYFLGEYEHGFLVRTYALSFLTKMHQSGLLI